MMKKQLIALMLVLAMLCASLPVSAAFTDVTDPAESRACELLAALGVVGGRSANTFDPSGYMTRAEFCKVALKLAGFSGESLYQNYTRFSDVPHNAWYAPYVNAAVKAYSLIEGYGDGTFRPNVYIKYDEALAILLRLLGYTRADIGDFWPADYMNKAQVLGLRKGISTSIAAGNAIPRGQAAILLVNTLLADTKDGAQLLSGSFTMDEGKSLLLATPETDSTLSAGTARICTPDGTVKVVAASTTLDSSGVMQRGCCVWQKGSLIYFHTAGEGLGTAVTVRSRTNIAITREDGSVLVVPSSVLLCDGTKAGLYSENWLDLPVGQTATLFYGDTGTLELIVTGSTSNISGGTAVYGVDDVILKSGAAVVRDGERVAASALQKYDIISYDSANNIYYASSDKLTLLYNDAGTVYTAPTWVDVGSLRLTVAPGAAADFAALKFGTLITVALDVSGRAAAVWPAAELSVRTMAVLDKLSESACTVTTLTGHELTGTPSFTGFTKTTSGDASTLYQNVGRLVTVTQDLKGNYIFQTVAYNSASKLDLPEGTVGGKALASSVRIFEELDDGLPLTETTLGALQNTGIDSAKVLYSRMNTSGKYDLLVVENITGAGCSYGLAKQRSEVKETTYTFTDKSAYTVMQIIYTITYRNASAAATEAEQTYSAAGLTKEETPAVWFLRSDGSCVAKALSYAGKVGADAFITSKQVKVGLTTLVVLTDVQVWAKDRDRFITLSEAVLNYQSFSLYCARAAADGGAVCFIIAE